MKRITCALLFLLALSPLMLAGCVAYQPMQFEPVRKATPVAPQFSQSYYFYDIEHNLYFVMRSHTTDSATGKPVDQIATIRVFWHPRGGTTTLDPSALNATLRYIVLTPDTLGMYEGAGFVVLKSKDGANKFEARMVDGDMRLTQASANFNDTLGRARVHGYFSARYDDARAMDMLLDAHREFFYRSLESKPAETLPSSTTPSAEDWGFPTGTRPATEPAPATAPATMPATTPQVP